MASVLRSTTCILEYAGAPNGWPRKSVCIEGWELLNKVLIFTSLVSAAQAPVMNKSWILQGTLQTEITMYSCRNKIE